HGADKPCAYGARARLDSSALFQDRSPLAHWRDLDWVVRAAYREEEVGSSRRRPCANAGLARTKARKGCPRHLYTRVRRPSRRIGRYKVDARARRIRIVRGAGCTSCRKFRFAHLLPVRCTPHPCTPRGREARERNYGHGKAGVRVLWGQSAPCCPEP